MHAEIIPLDQGALSGEALTLIADALRAGQLVVLPTETVYGLIADERHPDALQRIADLKGRPQDQPLSRLAASVEQIEAHGGVLSPEAKRLAEAYWPGPLTMVCPHQAGGTVGYRVPDHPVTLSVLNAVGAPLIGTSVNRHGEPEALTGQEAYDLFSEQVAVVVEGGPARLGQASTVIAMNPELVILREGDLSESALRDTITA